MAKAKKDEILKKIKEKQLESDRKNITFRVKAQLLERFREKCEKNGVTMTEVVETFMEDWVNE